MDLHAIFAPGVGTLTEEHLLRPPADAMAADITLPVPGHFLLSDRAGDAAGVAAPLEGSPVHRRLIHVNLWWLSAQNRGQAAEISSSFAAVPIHRDPANISRKDLWFSVDYERSSDVK